MAGMNTSSWGRPVSAAFRFSISVRIARSLVADGPRADINAIPAVAPATTRPFRDAFGPRVVIGESPIVAAGGPQVPFLPLRCRLALEAGEAFDDVTEEARLALLPIGDDVDARLRLLADDVGHRLLDQPSIGLAVVRLPPILRPKNGNEGIGSGEAADVRRQDPVRASLHRLSSGVDRRLRAGHYASSGRPGASASSCGCETDRRRIGMRCSQRRIETRVSCASRRSSALTQPRARSLDMARRTMAAR